MAMFGGPSSSSQQTFLLFPNAAAAAHPNTNVYDPKFHSNQRSSSDNDTSGNFYNDNSSIDHTSFYKRESTFRLDRSPNMSTKLRTSDGQDHNS